LVPALAIVTLSAPVWYLSTRDARGHDEGPPLALGHFVAVTDVAWRLESGCGAITVADTDSAAVLSRGEPDYPKQRRPSRLAVTSDGRLMLAKAWHHQKVLVSKWRASDFKWAEGWIDVSDSSWYGAAIAISPDDATLLVAGLDSVFKYDMANVTVDTLGPRVGSATITGKRQTRYHETAAGAIVFRADSRLAYVLTNDGLIYRLDVSSMTWQGQPLSYPVTHRHRDYRLTRTFASLSPDERTLVINTGDEEGGRGQVTLVDTQRWQMRVVDTPGLVTTWGVAFNYVGINRGMLAIHGASEVGVFRLADDRLEPIAVTRVPRPGDEYQIDRTAPKHDARFAALAWTGDGKRLVVNRGPYSGSGGARFAEWRILELHPEGALGLSWVEDFDSCVSVDWIVVGLRDSLGQDVVTLQKRPTLTTTPTASATPTMTLTPPASPTSTSTSTAPPPTVTASASPSSTATPTPTVVPVPLYLPLALREHCDPVLERSDIALVVDTSSSMAGQKFEDSEAAALLFVGMIDLDPGRSQVAVVRYDREAEVVRELTRSRPLVEAAIRSLHVRSGTHIDKGLRAGLAELQSPRHIDRNTQVLVLLTDGIQTGTPGEELRAGDEVRAAGVRVYTIGLGADVDEATLRTIAGADDRYYFAPDSGDLARIYGEIARDLMCPGVELWGGR
jgi:uncharacterized protein YegL